MQEEAKPTLSLSSSRVSTKSRIGAVLNTSAGIVGGLLLLGMGISTSRYMPENAWLVVDHQRQIYFAPPFAPAERQGLLWMRRSELPQGYRSDSTHRNLGAFFQEGRSMTGSLLEWIGILKHAESRWGADGSWRY